MGADIYLRSISDKARDKYQPEFNKAVRARDLCTDEKQKDKLQEAVSKAYDAMYPDEGYFRDSYNPSSLFWALDLSWWNDVGPLLHKKGQLPIKNAKKLLAMIEDRPVTKKRVEQLHKEKELGDTVDEWFTHWTEKRQRFINFLKKSIDTKEPLDCSI